MDASVSGSWKPAPLLETYFDQYRSVVGEV